MSSHLICGTEKLVLVGDIHADTTTLRELVNNYTTQTTFMLMGDVGIGFTTTGTGKDSVLQSLQKIVDKTDHVITFMVGNHDNLSLVRSKSTPNSVNQLGYNLYFMDHGAILIHSTGKSAKSYLVIGGAVSVDKHSRKEHRDWWTTETLTPEDVQAIRYRMDNERFSAVLTHDIPSFALPMWSDTWDINNWPADVMYEANKHQQIVAELVVESGAPTIIHGHMHKRYTGFDPRVNVNVIGLANLDGPY
jgi:UDP-2,3-diacylglucosamine pyrophosphatase LpxH